MNRRTALGLSVPGGAAIAARFAVSRAADRTPVIEVPRFELPLKVPPVIEPTARTETQDEYDIVQAEADQEILPGRITRIRGYQGSFPGPTIRVGRNRTVVLRHTNRLSVHTVVHLHGGVTPADSDGFATDMVLPGETRAYTYPNRQRGCTLWYHDHAMDRTGENNHRGLEAFYIVEDDEEFALSLPRGPFDVPLLLQDRTFNADGSLQYDTDGHRGFQGNIMLVNGVPWPKMEVATRKYRFRLLNRSNARPFKLVLSNGPLTLVGTDGGLIAEPVALKALPLSMAERAEVIIDFSQYTPGTILFLRNALERPPLSDLMRVDVMKREADDARIPPRLVDFPILGQPRTANTRTWAFRATLTPGQGVPPVVWTINGKRFDPDRGAEAKSPLGELEL